jgi:uncharacterized Ntn-hydrolase superfamily protein
MTYSIVALDPSTGDLGVAVQSKFLAVGAVVPWAKAGVGAIATQAYANVAYGPAGLELLRGGARAEEAVRRLTEPDEHRAERQVGIVDAHGGAATYTGRDCLAAAESAGGDRRGSESAALLVVRSGGGYGGGNDRWIDLRVDHHDDPVGELGRLLDYVRLYLDRPDTADLVPLDEALAGELRSILAGIGGQPGGRFGSVYVPMSGEPAADDVPRPFVGEPRPLPANWDDAWQGALVDWMGVENLEERTAAPGWIDPRVLAILRSKT